MLMVYKTNLYVCSLIAYVNKSSYYYSLIISRIKIPVLTVFITDSPQNVKTQTVQ